MVLRQLRQAAQRDCLHSSIRYRSNVDATVKGERALNNSNDHHQRLHPTENSQAWHVGSPPVFIEAEINRTAPSQHLGPQLESREND